VRGLRGDADVLAVVLVEAGGTAVHLVRGYRVDGTVNWICECPKYCAIHVEISIEARQRMTEQGWYVISDLCAHGPAADDKLEETHAGFKLYSNPSLQRGAR
jgi:hypothetical protein